MLTLHAFAQQVDIGASNQNWIKLTSYAGVVVANAFQVQINLRQPLIRVPNWSLRVSLSQSISNADGKTLDPQRVRLRLQDVQGGNHSLGQLGAVLTPIPLSPGEIFPVRRAKAPLATVADEYYQQVLLIFEISVEGGTYLDAFKSWNNYALGLNFSLLDEHDQVLSQSTAFNSMQLYPLDSGPVEPAYSIHVNGAARDGLLELSSKDDYQLGVSQTIPDGVTVTSSTAYAIEVKAASPSLVAGAEQVPVGTVGLTLSGTNGSHAQGTVYLAPEPQKVIQSANGQAEPQLFDLTYFTKAADERLLQAKPAHYQVLLIFTLVPQ